MYRILIDNRYYFGNIFWKEEDVKKIFPKLQNLGISFCIERINK